MATPDPATGARPLSTRPRVGWRALLPWAYSALFWLGLGLSLTLHEYAVWMPERPTWPWALRDAVLQWGAFVPLTPPLFAAVQQHLRHPRPMVVRAAVLTALLVAFTTVHTAVVAILTEALPMPPWSRAAAMPDLWSAILFRLERSSPTVGTHYVAVFAVAIALALRRAATAREREARELREQYLHAQLQALRSQLQPHFLFNTLHSIGVATRRDPDTASRMVVLLGDLLRAVLQTRDQQTVPLREELSLLEPYVEILKLRFRDRLTVTIDVAPDLQACLVPDLLLQPLVENAVRHGIEARSGPGNIEVRATRRDDDLHLTVRDDGTGPTEPHAEGTGLGNTRARLRALYGDAATLTLAAAEDRGAIATVRIPWQTHEVTPP